MLPILISLGILKSPTPESNQFNKMCSLISGLEDYFKTEILIENILHIVFASFDGNEHSEMAQGKIKMASKSFLKII